ncbi:MAG: universal stress protein [Alphaproteobacteria bacterium]|nr:universal stress protein [Alphaproteobacteria bacterium]
MDRPDEKRFRILVCIDGSDECYRGLRYAARLGGGVDADICLLFVRPVDQGLRSGGLEARVVRENMLEWGLELPGTKHLMKGQEILTELGLMSDDWAQQTVHVDKQGDPLGDNSIVYTSSSGKKVTLKLEVAPDIVGGILEEAEGGGYDLLIIGASERWQTGIIKTIWDPAVAQKVVARAHCSVIVARELEQGRGHLICTDGTENAIDIARKDAILASRCNCPISLITVVPETVPEAEGADILLRTRQAIEEEGPEVVDSLLKIGEPVEEIVRAGADYSVIVIGRSNKRRKWWLFETDIAYQVLERAENSVMIMK